LRSVAAPELALELVGLRVGAADREHFWKMNIHDMTTREQQEHHHLATRLA